MPFHCAKAALWLIALLLPALCFKLTRLHLFNKWLSQCTATYCLSDPNNACAKIHFLFKLNTHSQCCTPFKVKKVALPTATVSKSCLHRISIFWSKNFAHKEFLTLAEKVSGLDPQCCCSFGHFWWRSLGSFSGPWLSQTFYLHNF